MLKEEFQEWLESPVADYFFKYLTDSAKEESDLLSGIIIGGGIVGEMEQKRIATTCATLISIADIEFEEIEDFYNEKE